MAFDLETLLRFRPAKFWCQKCLALWKIPYSELEKEKNFKFLSCTVCKVKYIPTDQYSVPSITSFLSASSRQPLSNINDLIGHGTAIAKISNTFKSRQKSYPPFKSLLQAFIHARSFIHFVSYGISPMMIGILKLTAQYVPIRGIISGNIGENIISEITDFKDESQDLQLQFWKHGNFRGMDEPHHKLIVIDGLIAFKGSTNLNQVAWRSALNDMDIIEVVTDVDDVIRLHNRYFSPLWARLSKLEDEIPMTEDDVPF